MVLRAERIAHRFAPDDPATACYVVLGLSALLCLLRLAALVAGDLPLYFDEAQYWFWAQTPALGYFSKPPLIAWAIAGTTALCGDGSTCVKLAAPLAYLIAPVFVFLTARNLFGPRLGCYAGIAFATLPGVAFSGFIISTDPLLLAFWCAALWAYERALSTGRLRYWLAGGAAIGLGLLAKYAMIFIVLGIAGSFACGPRPPRAWAGLAAMAALALALVSPNLLWNARQHFTSFSHTADNVALPGALSDLGGGAAVVDFLGGQAAIIGPIFAVALVLLLVRARPVLARPGHGFLAWFSFPVLGLLIVQAFLSRAHGNWAAVAFPSLTILLVAWAVGERRERGLRLTLAVHGCLFLVLAGAVAVGTGPFAGLGRALDPFRFIRGWDRLAEAVVQDSAAQAADLVIVDDRPAIAELAYLLRGRPLRLRRWSNDPLQPDDHYAMVWPATDGVGQDALVVSRDPAPAALLAAFASSRLVETVALRPYHDPKGTYYLFIGRGFLGDRRK